MPDSDPAKTALLLMDFQNAIVARANDPHLPERAARLRAAARKKGLAVMHVRVAFTEADYAVAPRNKMFAPLVQSRAFTDGEPATAIHEALAPAADEEVFRKIRVGALTIPALQNRLKERGIDTLVLAGISTSGVVLSTVRDAADRDYRLIIVSDCCGDADPQVHRVLMEKVFPRQADIVTLEDFANIPV